MKLEGQKYVQLGLSGTKLHGGVLKPEWIMTEVRETNNVIDPESKQTIEIIEKITETSTIRLYVDEQPKKGKK